MLFRGGVGVGCMMGRGGGEVLLGGTKSSHRSTVRVWSCMCVRRIT